MQLAWGKMLLFLLQRTILFDALKDLQIFEFHRIKAASLEILE